MALKRLTTEKLRSVVTSNDRMSFTLFLAFAFHLLVVLGVNFVTPEYQQAQMTTLSVTIVDSKNKELNKDADYLAQANQRGAGNTRDRVEVKKKMSIASELNNPGSSVTEQFASSKSKQTQGKEDVLTQNKSDIKVSRLVEQEKKQSDLNIENDEIMMRQRDRTRIQNEFDQIPTIYSKKNLSYKIISANTRKSKYAPYMALWRKKVTPIGNAYYPKQARKLGLSGRVLLSVAVNRRGVIMRMSVLTSSGHKLLEHHLFPRSPSILLKTKMS